MRFIVMAGLVFFAAPVSPPTSPRSPSTVNVQDVYLTPMPAGLDGIGAGSYTRQAVVTRGIIESLETGNPGYFQLRDGPARVVVVPMPEVAPALRSLLGRRVEVVGYVRELERNQGTCRFRGGVAPQSICDDPELPPKPDLDRPGRIGWPNMSITVWSGSDITPMTRDRAGPHDSLADILDSPGKTIVTAVGRFCGANLCGGVTGPAPSPDAWVLDDGDTAIWVVGRRAQGNGFSLDPKARADTRRWLEVKGRIEACGTARCLHARSVALTASPQPEE